MKIIKLILFLLIFTNIYSQNICSTDEYNKPFQDANPERYAQIERDIQNYLNTSKQRAGYQITIPVVFHIVYNDVIENIHDSIIYQQLEILNKSFNARNADTIILTDTLKKWVGDFKINFELAYIDPNGLPTGGITRTQTSMSAFTYYGNYVKKEYNGKAPWSTNRYLNIWVCDLDNYLGYSQFPGGPEETDGVVLDWQIVGNQSNLLNYPDSYTSQWTGGKIAVHEVGHWLNLYHPWGNPGPGVIQCADDYIPETGLQELPVYPSDGCPDTLFSECDHAPFYQTAERVFVKNYMEYSGNNCAVCFTKNQVLRGLASLNTYRTEIIENYQPRPTINQFKETEVNPTYTQGRIYIELPYYSGEAFILIYDISGKIVYTSKTNQRFNEIFLNNSDGMYIVNISYENKLVFSKKIIINRL